MTHESYSHKCINFFLQITMFLFRSLSKDRASEEASSECIGEPLNSKGWPKAQRLSKHASVVLREKAEDSFQKLQ